ncbi:unnamed protein product [Amoebophrya sp. A120]|nr:unnamed protein product [Amoebophrya sp. A120]|eukprot:GSA120T00008067001.1
MLKRFLPGIAGCAMGMLVASLGGVEIASAASWVSLPKNQQKKAAAKEDKKLLEKKSKSTKKSSSKKAVASKSAKISDESRFCLCLLKKRTISCRKVMIIQITHNAFLLTTRYRVEVQYQHDSLCL